MRIQAPPRLTVAVLVVLVAAGVLAAAWHFTPLSELVQPEQIARRLEAFERVRWAPFAFICAYVIGGLVMFPVTVLSATTAIVFPPLEAVPVSFTGIMLSAALSHWLGARLAGGSVRKRLGPTIDRLNEALTDRSIVTIAAIRMLPLAPFTLVNLAAGSIGVGFREYMLGTALGLAPGISMVVIFGSRVRAFWRDPSVNGVLIVVGVCIAWIGMSLGLQKWVASRRNKARQRQPAD